MSRTNDADIKLPVRGLSQPWLGIASVLLCGTIALTILSSVNASVFGMWVSFFMITGTPALIVQDLVWKGEYPAFLVQLSQPFRGFAQLFITFVVGGAFGAILMPIWGGAGTPTPFAMFFAITTVPVTLWLVIILECQPAANWIKSPLLLGFFILLMALVISFIIYFLFYNFVFLADTPLYDSSLDFRGAFYAWDALTFVVTTAAAIMALVAFDFWPVQFILSQVPALANPLRRMMVTAIIVLGTAILVQGGMVGGLGMDIVDFQVRVPVSASLGFFIMLVLMQTAPFQKLKQPIKGSVLLIFSLLFGVTIHAFYRAYGYEILGVSPSGAPDYTLELWTASAMLAITFPVIVVFAGFFKFWPLQSDRAQ